MGEKSRSTNQKYPASVQDDVEHVGAIYGLGLVRNIANLHLGFECIEAHIQKDDCGGAYPSLQMFRGVTLFVKPEDLADGGKILSEMEAKEPRKIAPAQIVIFPWIL